jgi:protein arginine N-methyltransferase 7
VPPCEANGRPEHLFGSYMPTHFVVPARLRDKPTELIETVNDWHFAMINDLDRNKFYQTLLHAAIDPDSVVLEIGAGSGLLSIMAAKAGARRVIAIEANREMAALARQIIAANGMTDRIEVINKMSTDVDAAELGERPTILVSEILGTLLLGESALHYVEDARDRLLAPGGVILPALGTQYVTLVESEEVCQITSVCSWESIDLRHFNALQDTTSLVFTKQYGFRFSSCAHRLLSPPIAVLRVDFATAATRDAFPPEQRIAFQAVETGVAHAALASWDVSDAPRAHVMSTNPRDTLANFPRDMQWGQALQLLEDTTGFGGTQPIPLRVTKGEWLTLVVRYARDGVNFQCQVERGGNGGGGGSSQAQAAPRAPAGSWPGQADGEGKRKAAAGGGRGATDAQGGAGGSYDRDYPSLGGR